MRHNYRMSRYPQDPCDALSIVVHDRQWQRQPVIALGAQLAHQYLGSYVILYREALGDARHAHAMVAMPDYQA